MTEKIGSVVAFYNGTHVVSEIYGILWYNNINEKER